MFPHPTTLILVGESAMVIYLYVKQHCVTGMKYFGKTENPNPFKYGGSGKYWLRHIKKHGKHIKTTEVWGFDDIELCVEFALKFSRDNNIVLSDEWANLIEENGINGGDTRKPDEKRIPWNHGKKNCYHQTSSSNQKRSEALKSHWANNKHNRLGKEPWNKGIPNPEASKRLEKTRENWQCPHCGKQGSGTANKHRWHFDKCKKINA